MKKHTNVITLPKAFTGLGTRYITRSGDMWQPLDVALCMALTVRIHGTEDAVRATARRLSERVCMEQQPRLRALSRRPTNLEAHRRMGAKLNGVPDGEVMGVAKRIVERVTDLMGIAPGVPFEVPA